jgi:hypothetical protein
VWGPITVLTAANALVILGPVLGNPLAVSELVFYRLYDHSINAN